jgi:hypothetical protein
MKYGFHQKAVWLIGQMIEEKWAANGPLLQQHQVLTSSRTS